MTFEVRNGSFGYGLGKDILKDVTFSVSDGEVLAILGPNGVGKTTLLKCMMGLQRWRRGGTYLDGENLKNIPAKQLWRRIAYVPQAKNTVFGYTALEMVLLGRSAHIGVIRQPSAKDYAIAREAMAAVGITHLEGKLCSRISGGELQMVLIARAIATRPRLLVLDEPESNLDFKNQLVILETMRQLASSEGIACIFNTHYPAHALKTAHKSLLLGPGGETSFGLTGDIITCLNMRGAFHVNVHISDLCIDGQNCSSVIPLSIASS